MNSQALSRIFSLLLVIFFGAIASCSFYDEKNPPDPSTITPQSVSWQRVSTEFFEPRCAICHGQGGAGFDSSDYNGVIQELDRIRQRVLERKNMPPDSPLTVYEETLLTTWIDNGTPYLAAGGSQ